MTTSGPYDSPDDLPGLVVMNPESIGNPEQTPRVFVGGDLRRLLNPCDANAPSQDGYCGGVNGFHADDCPRAGGRGAEA